MKPEDLLKLSKKKLIDKLQENNLLEEERKAEMVMIRSEILARFKEEKIDGEVIASDIFGTFSVAPRVRITFKTTLDEAAELGAVITVQKVDTKALRKIHDKGAEVPGMQKTEYLSVRKIEEKVKE